MGLLDIDICGPSVPKMMGLEGAEIHQSAAGWSPVYVDTQDGTLGVMSIGGRTALDSMWDASETTDVGLVTAHAFSATPLLSLH